MDLFWLWIPACCIVASLWLHTHQCTQNVLYTHKKKTKLFKSELYNFASKANTHLHFCPPLLWLTPALVSHSLHGLSHTATAPLSMNNSNGNKSKYHRIALLTTTTAISSTMTNRHSAVPVDDDGKRTRFDINAVK